MNGCNIPFFSNVLESLQRHLVVACGLREAGSVYPPTKNVYPENLAPSP